VTETLLLIGVLLSVIVYLVHPHVNERHGG
jgi:hypothetical protein